MSKRYQWDEGKRLTNLKKHGFNFSDADMVLENPFRMDMRVERNGEYRIQSLAYVFETLAVLTVILVEQDEPRVISFRKASKKERRIYYEWLENDFDDA